MYIVLYIHIYIYNYIKNPTYDAHARGSGLPSCTLRHSPSHSPSPSRAHPPLSSTVRAHSYIYLYLSPPTTYTAPSSRRTTGIISVFPQTRLTRNVVQQALRALSTGRDILHPRPSHPISLAPPSAFDSTRLRRLIIHN